MTATIIPMHLADDTGSDLLQALSPEETAIKILQHHFPRLCNDIAMLVQRPFRLHWDETKQTASTDCKAEIFLSPHFFLEGQENVGYGTAYHEGGHILWSPYGVALLTQAEREGGETLRNIMNIVLDRKDDILTARFAQGFADTLRKRLAYICTMSRREIAQHLRSKSPLSEDQLTALLKHWKPNEVYEDFFFAAKWHKRARLRLTHKAMKYLANKRLLGAKPAALLWICKKIHCILGEPEKKASDKKMQAEGLFNLLCGIAQAAAGQGKGKGISPKLAQAIANMMKQYVAAARGGSLARLIQRLKSMPMVHPGPISVGQVEGVPVRTVKESPEYIEQYQEYVAEIQTVIEPLVRNLRRLDNPSEFTIYGQEEGELDLMEVARIATGLPGFHQETVTERNIDAELHLAIDTSGSMSEEKVEDAKRLATAFSEAMLSMPENLAGHLWSFNSNEICDYGPVSRQSGFVTAYGQASNSDTHMLRHVGARLAKSRKRRKILLVLGDDGPDNMVEAGRLSRQLMARGIIVIHLLVGVHGTPDIYPFELIYTSMEDCLHEFGNLLENIIKNLK